MLKRETATDLFAVVTRSGEICYSRGGSSTTPRLMIYDNEKSAKRAIQSPWIKQVWDTDCLQIRRIYTAPKEASNAED